MTSKITKKFSLLSRNYRREKEEKRKEGKSDGAKGQSQEQIRVIHT